MPLHKQVIQQLGQIRIFIINLLNKYTLKKQMKNSMIGMFMILLITIVSSAQLPSQFNRNLVELVMKKLSITPSRSLCNLLGKHKCDEGCCVDTEQFVKLRKFGEGEVQDSQNLIHNEEQLCNLTGKVFCGKECCLEGGCAFPEKQGEGINLKFEQLLCADEQPTSEEMCRGAGLLWCDGDCCGFDNVHHKCFSVNHYGVPYIRCPIEAPPKP